MLQRMQARVHGADSKAAYLTAMNRRRVSTSIRVPSWHVECIYYCVVAYSLVSAYLGIEIRLVAAGATAILAGFCYTKLGSYATRPISVLLACAASFVLIQILVHGISPLDSLIRGFIVWMCGMVVVQSLGYRTGFLQRCTIVIFLLGLIAVPSLRYGDAGSAERAAAGIQLSGNLQNANGLGAWFGFCFVSFALLGLETRRLTGRTLYWVAATASLLIAGLSVSRTAMLGGAIAVVLGFRDILRRGFVPLLALLVLTGVVLEAGLFDRVVSMYEARGLEDTGRLILWPEVLKRIATSPIVGFGVNGLTTYVPQRGSAITTPHNSFLFFALSGGIVPLFLWTLFWFGRGRRLILQGPARQYARFQLPFFCYLLVQFISGDLNNDPWTTLAVTVMAAPAFSRSRLRPAFTTTRGASNHQTVAPRLRHRVESPAPQRPSTAH